VLGEDAVDGRTRVVSVRLKPLCYKCYRKYAKDTEFLKSVNKVSVPLVRVGADGYPDSENDPGLVVLQPGAAPSAPLLPRCALPTVGAVSGRGVGSAQPSGAVDVAVRLGACALPGGAGAALVPFGAPGVPALDGSAGLVPEASRAGALPVALPQAWVDPAWGAAALSELPGLDDILRDFPAVVAPVVTGASTAPVHVRASCVQQLHATELVAVVEAVSDAVRTVCNEPRHADALEVLDGCRHVIQLRVTEHVQDVREVRALSMLRPLRFACCIRAARRAADAHAALPLPQWSSYVWTQAEWVISPIWEQVMIEAALRRNCHIGVMQREFGKVVEVFAAAHVEHCKLMRGGDAGEVTVDDFSIMFSSAEQTPARAWRVNACGDAVLVSYCSFTPGLSPTLFGAHPTYDLESVFMLLGLPNSYWEEARSYAEKSTAADWTQPLDVILKCAAPLLAPGWRSFVGDLYAPNEEVFPAGSITSVQGSEPFREPRSLGWQMLLVLKSFTPKPSPHTYPHLHLHRSVVCVLMWCFRIALRFLWEDREELLSGFPDVVSLHCTCDTIKRFLDAAFNKKQQFTEQQQRLWVRELAASFRKDRFEYGDKGVPVPVPSWVPAEDLMELTAADNDKLGSMVSEGMKRAASARGSRA
jgi:hypothetical protein